MQIDMFGVVTMFRFFDGAKLGIDNENIIANSLFKIANSRNSQAFVWFVQLESLPLQLKIQ